MDEILKFLNLKNSLIEFSPEVHNPFAESKNIVARKIRRSNIARTLSYKLFSKSQKNFLKEKLIFTKKDKPKMDKESRTKLIEYYSKDVKILETVLERKLPWPNFQAQ